MRAPRVQPPTPRRDNDQLVCPLDGSTLRRHDWSRGGWVSCGACQAYWSPRDVADGRDGHWDDSGLVCAASTVRLDASGAFVALDCVLGDDHADGVDENSVVHVSTDLVCWSTDDAFSRPAAARPGAVRLAS